MASSKHSDHPSDTMTHKKWESWASNWFWHLETQLEGHNVDQDIAWQQHLGLELPAQKWPKNNIRKKGLVSLKN